VRQTTQLLEATLVRSYETLGRKRPVGKSIGKKPRFSPNSRVFHGIVRDARPKPGVPLATILFNTTNLKDHELA
jgi:hypothetical protein